MNATQLDEATVPYDSCKGTASESVPGEVAGEVSPTMAWTQRCLNPMDVGEVQLQPDQLAVLALKRLEAHLSESGQRSLPLGGYEGFVAHCPPLYVQSHPMQGIRSGSVYAVHCTHFPTSLCPTCCAPLFGSNCHECGPDVPCLRLDPKPIEGGNREPREGDPVQVRASAATRA